MTDALLIQRLHPARRSLPCRSGARAQAVRSARKVILRCGRRSGKTSLLARELLWIVLKGGKVWWIAPTHALCRTGFVYCENLIRSSLHAFVTRYVFGAVPHSESAMEMEKPSFTRPVFQTHCKELGNDLVIFDEAATEGNGEQIVEQYISPTLLDRKGRLLIASTPKGRNWFADYCSRPDFVEVHATTYDNPFIDPQEIDSSNSTCRSAPFGRRYLQRLWTR